MRWWSYVWPFARTWWGTIVGVATILLAVYYGPRKMLETWDWYIERFTDSKVCQFLKEHPGEYKMSQDFGENYYQVNYWTPEALAEAVGFGRCRVARSLVRLKQQGRVELLREGWIAK